MWFGIAAVCMPLFPIPGPSPPVRLQEGDSFLIWFAIEFEPGYSTHWVESENRILYLFVGNFVRVQCLCCHVVISLSFFLCCLCVIQCSIEISVLSSIFHTNSEYDRNT